MAKGTNKPLTIFAWTAGFEPRLFLIRGNIDSASIASSKKPSK
jgi:hypothetical protein